MCSASISNKQKPIILPKVDNEEQRYEHHDQPLVRSGVRYQHKYVSTSSNDCKDEPPTDNPPLEISQPVLVSQQVIGKNDMASGSELPKTTDFSPINAKERHNDVNVVSDSSSKLEIASEASGNVKLSLSYIHPQGCPDFLVPSLDKLIKRTEEKCLQSYKFLDQSFSVSNILKKMCEFALELGTPPSNGSEQANNDCSSDQMSGKSAPATSEVVAKKSLTPTSYANTSDGCLETQVPIISVNDISKGFESVIISLVNEFNHEEPPIFQYMPSNIKYEKADFSCSLARIGDSCCPACVGDCASNSCSCGHAKSGVLYTIEGLVKKDFLGVCMSMSPERGKYSLSYCKDCPLERSKEKDAIVGCKGHIVRKFIKECWLKCSCNGKCCNRVVQQGIKRSLQVFMTPQGKGWGLRTLEDLPKGAFVCEFVGEILTIKELYSRISESSDKYEFPVLLDAGWKERVVKDEQALCLDATKCGNISRFINHRCFDANLIGIHVLVDNPEMHYYHFAFFTTRNIDAFEELTWDYGIDHNNHGNEFKKFECFCESKSCRDLRRETRSSLGKRRR